MVEQPGSQQSFFGVSVPPFLSGLPIPTLPSWGTTAALSSVPGVCGYAEVGGKRFALDCMTPDYAEIPWASVAVLPRWLLDRNKGFSATSLPALVDHRAEGKEGPIRSQGSAGCCTAASLASVLDHAVAVQSGTPGQASVLHLWSRYHTPMMSSAAKNNHERPIGLEAQWPYDARTACSWYTPCSAGRCDDLGVSCGQTPDSAQMARSDQTSLFSLSKVTRLESTDTETLRTVIAKGQDIWFGMYVSQSFHRVQGTNAVVPDFDARSSASGHAMALAGYKTQSNGTYFLIKNSWGDDWGDHGYAWIHETTLARNIHGKVYTVDVAPLHTPQPSTPNPPKPSPQPPSVCPEGLEPDAVLGQCVPPCPDGSPRALGYCPDTSQCPAGTVNVFGVCTIAPAPTQGRDANTGIQYRCGNGGCTYFIPYGSHGCTGMPYCVHTCVAPAYALATGPDGVSCTE